MNTVLASPMHHSLTFQLTPDEAVRARRELMGRVNMLASGRSVIAVWAAAVISVVVVPAVHHVLQTHGVPLYAEVVVALIGWPAIVLGSIGTVSRFLFAFVLPHDSVTVHVNDLDFQADGPKGSVHLSWRSVKRIADTTEFFIVYASEYRAVVLPRRAVPDDLANMLKAERQRIEHRTASAFALWGRRFPWG